MPAWLSALTAAASFWPLTSGIVALVGCGGVVDAAVVVGVVALLVVVGVVALLVVVGVVALLVVVVFVCVVWVGWPLFATDSVTIEPLASLPPGFGAWSTTVPGGSVEVTAVLVESRPSWSSFRCASAKEPPVRSGTATCGAPESITIVTRPPRGSSVASSGFCETTTPFGCFVGRNTAFGLRPSWPSRTRAACSWRPMRRGTATFGGRNEPFPPPVVTITVLVWLLLSRCVRSQAIRSPAATSASAPRPSSMPAPIRRSAGGPAPGGAAGGGPGGGGAPTSVSRRETTVASSGVGQASGSFVVVGGVRLDKVISLGSQDSSDMERLLVTGGCGYLGRALVHLGPQRGWEVRATWFRRPPAGVAEWVRADLRDPEAARQAVDGVDAVVHTAYRQGEGEWEANVEGTRAVAAAADGRRFVHLSTDLVFDGTRGRYREDDPPAPVGSSSRRSEEHTSELQSPVHLVCRLLLEKKKKLQKQPLALHTAQLQHHHHRITAQQHP